MRPEARWARKAHARTDNHPLVSPRQSPRSFANSSARSLRTGSMDNRPLIRFPQHRSSRILARRRPFQSRQVFAAFLPNAVKGEAKNLIARGGKLWFACSKSTHRQVGDLGSYYPLIITITQFDGLGIGSGFKHDVILLSEMLIYVGR